MKRLLLPMVVIAVLMLPKSSFAQLKIGVVDMERAVTTSSEGKKAEQKFTAKLDEYRKEIEKKQKELEDIQTRLRTGDRLMNEETKANLNRNATRIQTDLQRMQEDSEKALDSLRSELLAPIAQIAEAIVQAFAQEQGFTVLLDSSNPQNGSIIYVAEKANVTDEIIRRIDSEIAKAQAAAKKPPL